MTDEYQTDEYDWGGDGSDLHSPVAEHVRVALVPTDAAYPPPLDQLLVLGDARGPDEKGAAIAALGLTQAHVPDLVRMARDRALNSRVEDTPDLWGPIHAVHALQALDVRDYVGDLIPLLDVDSDWFSQDVPDLLGAVGEPAIEPLRTYLEDRTRWMYGRSSAATALQKIAEAHPELRERVVSIIANQLEHAAENYPDLNGFLISNLLDLQAVEALPAIRRAFEQDAIDESIAGDWSEIQAQLGQVPDPDDPLVERTRQRWDKHKAETRALVPPAFFETSEPMFSPAPHQSNKARKQKNKRKMSAASRKANKKKRK